MDNPTVSTNQVIGLEGKLDQILGVENYTPSSANPDRSLTFGEKAVGLSFNPGGDPRVYSIKVHFARLIDAMDTLKLGSPSGEVKRMCSITITELQSAQMWAVKALTWKD